MAPRVLSGSSTKRHPRRIPTGFEKRQALVSSVATRSDIMAARRPAQMPARRPSWRSCSSPAWLV